MPQNKLKLKKTTSKVNLLILLSASLFNSVVSRRRRIQLTGYDGV